MGLEKYAIRKPQADYLLSEESATEQLVDLLTYYDIDVVRLTAGDSKEERQAASGLEKSLDSVVDAIRRGVLEVKRDDVGKLTVIQKLKGGSELTYAEVAAKHKLAMERFDANAGYSRIYAFMGALCGIGKTGIEKLPPQDLGIVEVLGTVFSNA